MTGSFQHDRSIVGRLHRFYRPQQRVSDMSRTGYFLVIGALTAGMAQAEPAPSFHDLLAQAQATAPRVAAGDADVNAAQGRALQAAAWPNPTMGVEAENFAGSGSLNGFDGAETTVAIEQPIELGGKRGARIAAARAEISAAEARAALARAEFARDLAIAYAEAEAADARLRIATEALDLARSDARATATLVANGREAELRAVQAGAGVAAAEAELEAARAERTAALARLAAIAGMEAEYTGIAGGLLNRVSTNSVSQRHAELSPAVAAARAERMAAARRVEVERSRRAVDLSVSFGVRRLAAEDATALVAGVSAPLPIFDRNRGNIAAAAAELTAADARLAAAINDARAEHRSAAAQAQAASARVAAAQAAEQAAAEGYRLARIGYDSGRLPLLEVLSNRRALIDARTRLLEAQVARVRAEAELSRLENRAPFGGSL